MTKMIPYACQDIKQNDVDAVVEVLRSELLTQGPVAPRFEEAVASYCKAGYAVAVNSATSALHLACLSLGVGAGDRVWTSPITFVATANSAIYCGALVDFVDIDPRTYNMSVQRLAAKLEVAARASALPKVVIPVHLCGQSCDMQEIHELSRKYGFRVIEDASHAIGGRYHDEPIGSCRYSDITIFSFHPVKIITTGEGGMAVTNDETLAQKMRLLRSHGISSIPQDMHPQPNDEIWNYQQIELGFNYRMTELQAALGISQLCRLDEYVEQRHCIAQRYNNELIGLPIELPWQQPGIYSSYHLYPILIKQNKNIKTQRQVYDALHVADIKANLHYIPVYRQPYYESMGFNKGYCPEAERYYKMVLSIPMYPTLTDAEQTRVISVLREVLL